MDIIVGDNVSVDITATNSTVVNPSAGLFADGIGASIDVGSHLTVSADGSYVYGIRANGGGEITIGSSADITTSGDNAHGAFADYSTMAIGDGATINTSGYNASGALANYESIMTIGEGATITTSGDNAHGAWASLYSSMDIGAGVTINTTGEGAYGAWAVFNSSMDIREDATITTSGDNAYGAYAVDNSTMDIGAGATITTSGSDAFGAWADYNSTMAIGEGTIIATLGDYAYGAYARIYSSMDIGDGATITTSGDGAHGALAQGDSTMDIGKGATINTTGVDAHGAYASLYSSMDIGEGAIIKTTGESAHAVYAGFSNFSDASSITLNGGTFSATGTDAYAILAERESSVTGSGVFDITGDVRNNGNGLVELTMDSDSVLTGAVQTNAAGAANLNMADSRWNVTGDSNLTRLDLDSTVVDYSGAASWTTVTAGTLDGAGGTFLMKADVVNSIGDKLEITNTMNGSQHYITVLNSGSAATKGNEIVDLVDTADATGNFQLTNAVELGAWQYSLRQVSGGSYGSLWQLYATGQLSSTASAAVNTFASGYLMGYVETTTLIQRLGELRDTTMQNGVWARVHGGKFNTDGMRHGKEFDLDYGGVQIGYDRKLATAWDGSLYAGIMFGYAKGDIDFGYAGGDGDVKSKTLGVYGTYKQADGFYVDAVLKYQWIDYDFNTYNSAGTKVTANEPDGGGFGLSLEVGKRFEMKNNWFVEPQAQLSYQKQDGGTFYMSNGLRLGVDDWTSLLGRLGVRVGYESGAHSFYAKLSWVKEFDGDFDFTANGIGFRDSFGDNWWVYGIGYVSKINERNSLYLDLERSSGGVFEQDWAVKGGWRVEM